MVVLGLGSKLWDPTPQLGQGPLHLAVPRTLARTARQGWVVGRREARALDSATPQLSDLSLSVPFYKVSSQLQHLPLLRKYEELMAVRKLWSKALGTAFVEWGDCCYDLLRELQTSEL